jgi:hypothetical protein
LKRWGERNFSSRFLLCKIFCMAITGEETKRQEFFETYLKILYTIWETFLWIEGRFSDQTAGLAEHTVGNDYFIIPQSSGSAILEGHATFPWPLGRTQTPLWQATVSVHARGVARLSDVPMQNIVITMTSESSSQQEHLCCWCTKGYSLWCVSRLQAESNVKSIGFPLELRLCKVT